MKITEQSVFGKSARVLPARPLLPSPSADELSRGDIIITAIGRVEDRVISAAAEHLEKTFRYKSRVLPALSVPRGAFDSQKNQYDPDLLLNEVWNNYRHHSSHILALADIDFKDPHGKWPYTWAWGQAGAGIQLVSLYRLKTPEKGQTLHRTLVVSQKRIGHTFGIAGSSDDFSFAYSKSQNPDMLDLMHLDLMPGQKECAEFIRRYETELSPPVSEETLVRLEKEAASRKWIPPVLYAWALIDVALGDYIASPDAQKFTLAEKTLRHFIVKKHAEGFAALGLALIYDVLGDGKKAVAELNRVKRANDTALGIFYHPAISSLREGNVERAVIMLEREFLIKGIYSDAGARGGKKKHGYGIVQKLFNEYEQAIKSEILRRPYLFNLPLAVAYNYERQNENEKAVLILKNIIGGNPAYSSGRRHAWMAHNLLAWVYSAKLGRNITEARSHAEKAVSLNPKSGAAFDTLGWTHHKMGDHKKALPLLKNASKLDPDPEIKEHIRIVEDILKSPPMIR